MSTTTETASAQPPRAACAGSDVEDGEVTESDNDAVIMVEPPKAVAIAEERRSSDQEANKKRVVISEESGTIDLTKPEISGSSKLARKRQNRSIRKHQEQTEKKAKTSAQIKQLEAAEMDEFEMLCVRGASPPRMLFDPAATFDKHPSVYASDDSEDDDQRYLRSTFQERREHRRRRSRRRQRTTSTEDPNHSDDGICFFNYRGQCTDPTCKRSHEFRTPRKLELCKFFLTGQCVKSRNCTYMHTEFPCKYYYLGITHDKTKCMFAHGGPLEPAMQGALLKHIERAPKQILGDFPKIYQTNAGQMMRAQHEKLTEEFNKSGADSADGPSKAKKRKKKRSRRRDENGQSGHNDTIVPDDESGRWSPSGKLRTTAKPTPTVQQPSIPKAIEATATPVNRAPSPPVVSRRLDRMTDILTPGQIAQLRGIGVEFDHQIDQLTVAQMNEIGVGIGQIHQIQLSAMNAKRAQEETNAGIGVGVGGGTASTVRLSPVALPTEVVAPFNVNGFYQDSTSQDIDMRFPVPASGTRPAMPDLSAFGIEANSILATTITSNASSLPVGGSNPSAIVASDRPALSFSNLLVNATKSESDAKTGNHDNNDDDEEDDDDDVGQLVINDEFDPENDTGAT